MNSQTSHAELSQNWSLLIACCQEDNTHFTRLCTTNGSDIHWQSLYAVALQEGIAPLLFWSLRQAGILEKIPPKLATAMSRKYYATAAAAAFCAFQLQDLLPRCQTAGVQVIILKGAMLAELHYPNPALRPMSDIDILVKARELEALDTILSQSGYKTALPPQPGLKDTEAATYLTTRIYRRLDGGGLPFHVHTHLLNSTIPNDYFLSNFPIAPIWAAARRTRIVDTEALVLDPRHQIMHLAEHSLRVTHSLTRLQYLYDIHRVIHHANEEIDWQTLCSEAHDWQMSSFLYYPLSLARQWLKTIVPLTVTRSLQPAPGILERLFASLLAKNIRRPGLSYLLHLSRQPSFSRQLAFVARTVFPPRWVLARRGGISLDEVGTIVYLRRVAEISATLLTTIIDGLHRTRNSRYERPISS